MFSKKKLGNTDILLSPFSIGTATFGDVYGEMDPNIMQNIVKTAIQNGLNYFDTSPYYGITKSEYNLGKALRGIPRDDFIISTKVGRYGDTNFDFSEKTILSSIDDSLKRLNLEYVDILLAHDIEYGDFNQIINETLPALQKIKDSGKARYIGFSCYPINLFKKVINATSIKLDVILSYAHFCLINNKLETIIPYLQNKEIGIINASPLCLGLLSINPAPKWHKAPIEMVQYIKQQSKELKVRFTIKIEDIALNYVLHNTNITTTLVGIKNMAQLENLFYILNTNINKFHEITEYICWKLTKYKNVEF